MLRVRVWLSQRAAIAMFPEYVYIKYCYVNLSIVLNDRRARACVIFFSRQTLNQG